MRHIEFGLRHFEFRMRHFGFRIAIIAIPHTFEMVFTAFKLNTTFRIRSAPFRIPGASLQMQYGSFYRFPMEELLHCLPMQEFLQEVAMEEFLQGLPIDELLH